MSILSYTVLINYFLNNKKISLFDTIRQVLKQHSVFLHKLDHFERERVLKTNFVTVLVLMNWVLMTTIISHSFSCSLLNTYFKSKPVKVVETIEDVLAKPDLNVAGTLPAKYFGELLGDVNLKSTLNRVEKYERKMKIFGRTRDPNFNFVSKQILKDVLKGEAILLVNSFLRVIVQDTYADFNLKKGASYSMQFLAYRVSSNFSFSKKITIA